MSPTTSSSYGMSHSLRLTDVCLPAFQVLEVSSVIEAVESWLSRRYAVPAEPEEPEVPGKG